MPLSKGTKAAYALDDHTLNVALSVLSLFYLFFLTEIAGLRPALAAVVLLLGRTIDAFTDPWMGRISDVTRSRLGRRRPYFLIGAIPFGLGFAALWIVLPDSCDSRTTRAPTPSTPSPPRCSACPTWHCCSR